MRSSRESRYAIEALLTLADAWREECSESDPCELDFRWKGLKPAVEDAIARTTLDEVRRRGMPAHLGAAGA
jgi:DNA-binding IscR family transcriptional regulator